MKLGFDDPFSSVSALGIVGNILDQDCFNMEKVQFGLETTAKPTVTFASYQEDNLKWMQRLLRRYVEGR
ncbi:hypothetical protein ACFSVJ_06850 [Prauserella oleivorans]